MHKDANSAKPAHKALIDGFGYLVVIIEVLLLLWDAG